MIRGFVGFWFSSGLSLWSFLPWMKKICFSLSYNSSKWVMHVNTILYVITNRHDLRNFNCSAELKNCFATGLNKDGEQYSIRVKNNVFVWILFRLLLNFSSSFECMDECNGLMALDHHEGPKFRKQHLIRRPLFVINFQVKDFRHAQNKKKEHIHLVKS